MFSSIKLHLVFLEKNWVGLSYHGELQRNAIAAVQ